jgi:hypothetical protein
LHCTHFEVARLGPVQFVIITQFVKGREKREGKAEREGQTYTDAGTGSQRNVGI